MTFRAAALLLPAAILALPARAAAAPPPNVTQYARAVHTLRAEADRLASSPTVPGSAAGRLRRGLDSLDRVRAPSGVIETDLPALASVAATPASLRAAARSLDALDNALRTRPQRAANPAELAVLDSVLRDSRFHPGCTLTACVEQALGALLQRLGISPPASNAAIPAYTVWIIAGLFLLLVIGIAVLLARSLLAGLVVTAGAESRHAGAGEPADRAAADALAAAGDYREAVRALFLATLQTLGRRHQIDLPPSLTNREWLRASLQFQAVLPSPAQRAALEALVDEFDRAWYGHLPVGADGYERCRALADRALAAGQEAVA